MRKAICYVYIITNKYRGTLYVGVTKDLTRRLEQHRLGKGSQFVAEHKLFKLVYFEVHDVITEALRREKNIKSWNRNWKIELVESVNPDWNDLAHQIPLS